MNIERSDSFETLPIYQTTESSTNTHVMVKLQPVYSLACLYKISTFVILIVILLILIIKLLV